MGKTSKPKYASGVVNVNGQNKASHYKSGNTVYSNYNMSDAEKKIYDFAENSFLSNLPNVNVFSEDTQKDMRNQLNAYTQKGLDTINELYTPMLSNLKDDIASRFGNLDNSVFMDNLSGIESNRADSMNMLAQDIMAKRDEIIGEELAKRYDYLAFLDDIKKQTNQNIMDYLNQASTNSKLGTEYNMNSAKFDGNSGYRNFANMFGRSNYANLATSMLGSSNNPYARAAALALKMGRNFL